MKPTILLLLALLQHLLAKSYSIDRYDISIQISDCSPIIQEKFYLTFTGGSYSSFERSVPITDFSSVDEVGYVTDESMNSYKPTVTSITTDSRTKLSNIKWTFPNTSGRKIFSLTYQATNLIQSSSSASGESQNTFSWIVGGQEWAVPLYNISTTVKLSSALTEEEVFVTPGYETFTTTTSGTSLYFFKKEHHVGDLLKITLTFPERYSGCSSTNSIAVNVFIIITVFANFFLGMVLLCLQIIYQIIHEPGKTDSTPPMVVVEHHDHSRFPEGEGGELTKCTV